MSFDVFFSPLQSSTRKTKEHINVILLGWKEPLGEVSGAFLMLRMSVRLKAKEIHLKKCGAKTSISEINRSLQHMGSTYSSLSVPQYKAMQTMKNVVQDSKPTCGWRTSWKYRYLTEEVPGVLYDLLLVNEERGHDHHPAHITTLHHSLAAAVCVFSSQWWLCLQYNFTNPDDFNYSQHQVKAQLIPFCAFYWPYLIWDMLLKLLQPATATVTPQAPLHTHIFHFVLLMLFLT